MWKCKECGKEVTLEAEVMVKTYAGFRLDEYGSPYKTAFQVKAINKDDVRFKPDVDERKAYTCHACHHGEYVYDDEGVEITAYWEE